MGVTSDKESPKGNKKHQTTRRSHHKIKLYGTTYPWDESVKFCIARPMFDELKFFGTETRVKDSILKLNDLADDTLPNDHIFSVC